MKLFLRKKIYFAYFLLFVLFFRNIEPKEIGSKDILLEDNPTYNLKKENTEKDKIKEEYEDTEFEIGGKIIFTKKRNLPSIDTNETILKLESKSPSVLSREKDGGLEIYGGTGNFLGGSVETENLFSHNFRKKDFLFSIVRAKMKSESYEFFERKGNWVGDSGKTENQFTLKGVTYLNEFLKISYDSFFTQANLSMQDNPFYKKQKKNSSQVKVDVEYLQSEKLLHKIGFSHLGLYLEADSRFLPISFGSNDKNSNLRKNSANYEANWDFSENIKLFSFVDYSFYEGSKKQTNQFLPDKEKLHADEGRFRGGIAKKEEGDFLKGLSIQINWDYHTVRALKNFSGGELQVSYRIKNLQFGSNFSQTGKALNYAEFYVENDLSDFTIELNRTKENKFYGFVRYELPDGLRLCLRSGKNVEFGKYIYFQTKDFLYRPTRVDVGYEFTDLEFSIPFLRIFEVGGVFSYRNYDRSDLPYLPKYLADANFKLNQENFSIELRAHYSSNIQINQKGDRFSDQRRIDLIYYHSIFKQFDFRFEVRNLEDRELLYREHFYYPGRQILFGMRVNF